LGSATTAKPDIKKAMSAHRRLCGMRSSSDLAAVYVCLGSPHALFTGSRVTPNEGLITAEGPIYQAARIFS
jgi:hypothetical protein